MADRRPRSDGLQRTRRRFARRQWARRLLTWRYVLVGALVVALIGLGVYGVYFSPWLRAEEVSVTGTEMLTEKDVLAAADVETGGALASVDLAGIERRIAGNLTTVESVDVARVWPHEVQITIEERTPVAVFDAGTGLQYVDATGTRFGSLQRLPQDLPLIVGTAEVDNLALNEAAAVVASLSPEVATLVDRIEVATVDQIELRLRDGRVVRWGSAERSEDKAEVLLALMERDAEVYDVSVPGRPTTS